MKSETEELKDAMHVLQEKRVIQLDLLKDKMHTTYESLIPINLIKNAIQEVSSSVELKNALLGAAIGAGTGYLSKTLWVGNSHNPLKKLVGTLIQFTIAGLVTKHSEHIISKGENILKAVLNHANDQSD